VFRDILKWMKCWDHMYTRSHRLGTSVTKLPTTVNVHIVCLAWNIAAFMEFIYSR